MPRLEKKEKPFGAGNAVTGYSGEVNRMEIVFIILIFGAITFLTALNFYILAGRKVAFSEALRLTAVASALNKIFFTATGYLAASAIAKNKNLEFRRAMAVFLVLEATSLLPWLLLGVYFGAKIALRWPLIFISLLAIFCAVAWAKKDKLGKVFGDILESFAATCKRFFLIIPFVAVNMVLLALYYFFIFRLFNFTPGFSSVVKIVAVTFTIGYLSPAPAGLGFKEAGMVFLLARYGVPSGAAIYIAIADRIIMTLLVGIGGSIFGFDLIKEEFKKRLSRGLSNLPK